MFLLRAFSLIIFFHFGKSFDGDPISLTSMEDRIGTLLITQRPIAFTSLTWRLIFEWNLTPLETTLDTLKTIYTNITRTKFNGWENDAIIHIKEALNNAENDFEAFSAIVKGNVSNFREKRELPTPQEVISSTITGTTGSIARSVFGIATAEEMDVVHSYLDTLFRRETKLVTIQKLQITTVKNVQSQLDSQQLQLEKLVEVTSTLYKTLDSRTKNRTEASVANLLLHTDLVSAIGMFKTSIVSYRQILTSLDRGFIDRDLLSPKTLQTALLQVKDQMPTGFRLIFDPTQMSLQPYYTLRMAARLPGSRNIRGLLQIPLTGLIDNFVLYKSVPFPSQYSNDSTRRFILKDTPRYIALAQDNRRFMNLGTLFNPYACEDGPLLVCPTTAPTVTEPSSDCLFHIISGNLKIGKTRTKCELIEIETDDTYIEAIDEEQWAISTTKPILMQPVCLDLNLTTTPTMNLSAKKVMGNVVARIPRHCRIIMEHHDIPMRLVMTSNIGQLPSTLSIPPLHSHALLELHGTQIINDKINLEFNSAFKEILEIFHNQTIHPKSSSKQVHSMISQMLKEASQITKIQPTISHSISLWTIINWILWICGIVGIVCLIIWIRKRPPAVTTIEQIPMYISAQPPTD